VVENDRPDVFAERIVAILAGDEFGSAARASGPRFVSERFGMERMIDDTLRLYGFEP
jgi:hypothetical protein